MKKIIWILICVMTLSLTAGCKEKQADPEGYTTLVTLDVNPSIQLQLDEDEIVLHVIAGNKEAESVIGDMQLANTEVEVAINALIGSLVKAGYLDSENNTILLSIENRDEAEKKRIEDELISKISGALLEYDIDGAILAQDLNIDETLQNMVDKYDISYGKAALILEILKQNKNHSEEELVKLSAQELTLIYEANENDGQEKDDGSNATLTGTVSTAKYISKEEALAIALADANLTRGMISDLEIDFDYENHEMTYKIEFTYNGFAYEYEIGAVSRNIARSVEQEKEKESYTDYSYDHDYDQDQYEDHDEDYYEDHDDHHEEDHYEIHDYDDHDD